MESTSDLNEESTIMSHLQGIWMDFLCAGVSKLFLFIVPIGYEFIIVI